MLQAHTDERPVIFALDPDAVERSQRQRWQFWWVFPHRWLPGRGRLGRFGSVMVAEVGADERPVGGERGVVFG